MTDVDDPAGHSQAVQQELDKLGDTHSDVDLPHVKRFVQKVGASCKDSTMAIYLANLRKTSQRIEGHLAELDEAGLDEVTYDLLHEHNLAQSSVRNIQYVLRKFLEVAEVEAEWVEDYELLPQKTKKVSPEDMLLPEDIAALTDAAERMRDIALIEFLADTGARIGLAASLRIGDLDLEGDEATYTPNENAAGLKGADIQPYPLIDSVASLRAYLSQTHPRPEQDDVALFHVFREFDFTAGGALAPGHTLQRIKGIAEKAGVDKPTNHHNFRHSAVTRMVREGYSRSEIEHRVHWEVDSDMWAVYEHIAGEDHNDAIFEKAGVKPPDVDGPSVERIKCGTCREPLAPHHDYCPRCGTPASKHARETKRSAISSVGSGITVVRERPRQRLLADTINAIETYPRVLDDHDESSSRD